MLMLECNNNTTFDEVWQNYEAYHKLVKIFYTPSCETWTNGHYPQHQGSAWKNGDCGFWATFKKMASNYLHGLGWNIFKASCLAEETRP